VPHLKEGHDNNPSTWRTINQSAYGVGDDMKTRREMVRTGDESKNFVFATSPPPLIL
jgi:hypothetical protein